jgi:hypothetical protein
LGAKSRYTRSATRSAFVFAFATQFLEQGHRAGCRLTHIEFANLGELDNFAGRHRADQCIAMVSARLQCRQNGQEVIFQKEHGRDHNVALLNVFQATLKFSRTGAPLRCGMQS